MATIRIEPSDMTKSAICAQCGGSIRRAHGFVYANESAHGVYFLGRCAGVHPVRAAFLTVALGEFTVEASSNRQSFAVEWRMEGMGLMDCPVRDHPELLGRFVPRSAALALPDLGHLWHVVDHIILDDVHARTVGRWLADT